MQSSSPLSRPPHPNLIPLALHDKTLSVTQVLSSERSKKSEILAFSGVCLLACGEFGDRPRGEMWNRPAYAKGGDVESGARPLYPMMLESPELRWAFIRKIYAILTVQMLTTVGVAAVVVSFRPISFFSVSSSAGRGLYIFLIIFPFIVLCPLYYYHQKHP